MNYSKDIARLLSEEESQNLELSEGLERINAANAEIVNQILADPESIEENPESIEENPEPIEENPEPIKENPPPSYRETAAISYH